MTSDTEIHNWEASAQDLLKNLHDLDSDSEEEEDTTVSVEALPCSIKECFEIAEKLKISPFTVEGHRKNLMQKTNSKNVVGLIKYSLLNNIF